MVWKILKKNNTIAWKGLGALMIMINHLLPSTVPIYVRAFFSGNLWVALFFFFSGYGLRKSFDSNDFYKLFLRKKIIKVYVPFVFAELIMCLVRNIVGINVGWKAVISSIVGYPLQNSTLWYIVEICVIYIFFYIIKSVNIQNDTALFIVIYFVFVTVFVFFDFGTWWYISTIGVLMGLEYKRLFSKKDFILKYKNLLLVVFLLFYFLSQLLGKKTGEIICGFPCNYILTVFYLILAPLFVLLCLILCERFELGSFEVFKYFGNISLEIYLYHIPIGELLCHFISNRCISMCISIISTIVFAIVANNIYRLAQYYTIERKSV